MEKQMIDWDMIDKGFGIDGQGDFIDAKGWMTREGWEG